MLACEFGVVLVCESGGLVKDAQKVQELTDSLCYSEFEFRVSRIRVKSGMNRN